ncbi:MAG: hypothetical protein GY727_08935 [Gammaproteobacteria bacterium]|nr:hypothetical protein [Gammaproteobacteria bacterium]MCP4089583.1 hypothetical protein [Gammaproteobacteria bacterium]MCP4278082.1 hypothetical protein [Gammaproteobacteria bacterium]MCP4832474.1 hypothetical protein [Gammaproteobacteria bacterium]MCP4930166.1 hypothetical protein [Gammaproteobacteria bacterium]
MKINQILGIAVAVALFGGSSAVLAGGHEGGAAIAGEGSCTFIQENMFAGPFNVCQEPVGADSCAEIGQTDDNADAVHADGACPTEGLVGTCDLGDSQLHYFTGDAGGLEIGCGFQGGDWIAAE